MACGVWICHQVAHVSQCAMRRNLLFCDKFDIGGHFFQKGIEICCF